MSNTQKSFLIAIAMLITFIFVRVLIGADATIRWDANMESDLSKYKIYYGTISSNYGEVIDVGNVTNYTVVNLMDSVMYYFAITALDFSGNESNFSNEVAWSSVTTSLKTPEVEENVDNIIAFNYENPFDVSDGTIISFTTPDSGSLTIEIYTAAGNFIRTLVENYQIESGTTSFLWNGQNDKGILVSSGIYMGVISINNNTTIIKMAVKP